MSAVVISALLLSFIVYLYAGYFWSKRTKGAGDLFPMVAGREAQIKNSNEFSASTVAATVSLSTLIIAYYELAPYFGLWWLLWTVITTTAGIFVVRIFARKIWSKVSQYDHRPTLHSFLGKEFGSQSLTRIAAICTSIGFLGVIATELTVGSKFLAGLIPEVPQWISVIVLSVIAFLYSAAGGFRVMIVSDRIQMWSIWLLIAALGAFYLYYIGGINHFQINMSTMPENILKPTWREGLLAFLVGVFLINTPYYLADMSIHQRINASQNSETVFKGLWKSVTNSALSWTLLLLLAVFVFAIITPVEGENSLVTLLNLLGTGFGGFGKFILFVSVLGLLGAMLSTASTQLVAVSHTLYEDILSKYRSGTIHERADSKKELSFSRIVLIASAVLAVGIVELLSQLGFSIADLVFSIYGAQLSLTPLVLVALFRKSDRVKTISGWATAAVTIGFLSGWIAAITGKLVGNGDLVFLSPAFSISLSTIIICVGLAVSKPRTASLPN